MCTQTFSEHLVWLRNVFDRLKEDNLLMKAKKCSLFQTSVEYRGHTVSNLRVMTSEDKVHKVNEWPTSVSQTEVRQFLGLPSYYRCFMKDYARLTKPMHGKTRNLSQFIFIQTGEKLLCDS